MPSELPYCCWGSYFPAQRTAISGEININYPGAKPPGLTPEVFSPGFISEPGAYVFNISFALGGQTIVYSRKRGDVFETLVTEYKDGRWTKPQIAPPQLTEVPSLISPSKAYYAVRDNIFATEKTAGGWGKGKPSGGRRLDRSGRPGRASQLTPAGTVPDGLAGRQVPFSSRARLPTTTKRLLGRYGDHSGAAAHHQASTGESQMNNVCTFSQRARIAALAFAVPMLIAASLQAGDIHTAAAAGDLNTVRALLEADMALLESKDGGGSTPLLSACAAQQAEVANFLLDKGANVKAETAFR